MQALLNAIAQMAKTVDAHRVFHGRGGLYPGCEHLTLDWFAPIWVLTSFKAVSEDELAQCHAALAQRWETLAPGEPLNWVFQCR
ncbi:MAG: class I SAM-dependent methyltransferase, partial [Limnohabitans sp.]|nr:class I SAM-dependent methyltransferase [Limnohabitans sp.]